MFKRKGVINIYKKLQRKYSEGGLEFPGAPTAKSTFELKFESKLQESWPIYRIIDEEGKVINEKDFKKIDLTDERLVNMYKSMVRINVMDDILYNAQRQGRISFYMTNYGEESSQIGSAEGIEPTDEIYSQYREAGVLLHRGFTFQEMMNQCFGTKDDYGKGRQMPVHYGSKKLHFQTISSPLATQIPQAAGTGYAFRLEGKGQVCMCYFGEGAASEGDFHAGLNFASTLKSQTIFFCRNNGYAISTPSNEQYIGDGIVSRGIGYGIHSIRVDGNDLFAVYLATKQAREFSSKNGVPILIESMTYRVGHHSTSDDSTRYRSGDEVKKWNETRNPITRTKKHLMSRNLWNDEMEKKIRDETRKEILSTLENTEKMELVSWEEMFNDVYNEKTNLLKEQEEELKEHIEKYKSYYLTKSH